MSSRSRYVPNNQNRPVPAPPVQTPQLDQATLQSLLETQRLEAQNEAQNVRLREKEMDLNADYAKESLKAQVTYINNKPAEDRKTLTRFALIAGAFILLLMIFVIYCLHIGERDFISKVLSGVSYLITTGLGYYFGQKTNNQNKPPSTEGPNASVVE